MAGKNKKGTRNPNGMGNIYKTKSGRYEYKKMVDGEFLFTSASSASDLKKQIEELRDAPSKKYKVRIHDFGDTWLETYIKPLKKPTTYSQYEFIWRRYVKPNIKNVYVGSVTSMMVQQIISDMSAKGFSTSTMKHVKKVTSIIFERAKKEKIITLNPASYMEIPDIARNPRKLWNADEIQTTFSFLKTSRWYWPIRFMLVTGLRRGELLALKWSDIDETNQLITISDNLTNCGIGSTKSNKPHYVAYSAAARLCIESFKKQLKKENNRALFANEKDIIFVGLSGEPIKPKSLNNVFDRVRNHTGIHVSPHCMRHTFVYYSKNKLTLSELKDTLGHDDTTSTLDIYGDMLFDSSAVAGKIDSAFAELLAEKPAQETGKVVSFDKYKNRAK